MSQITYLIGDATAPSEPGNKVICHICNDAGRWGKGFVLAISRRWPQPESEFRKWYQARSKSGFALGATDFVLVEPGLWVANIIGQHGITKKGVKEEIPPIRYEAVASGLEAVAKHAHDHLATVHMPRIGCGLAGGTWDQIEPIIQEKLCANGLGVFVYDFAPA